MRIPKIVEDFCAYVHLNCCAECPPGACCGDIVYDYVIDDVSIGLDPKQRVKKIFASKEYPCLHNKKFHEFLSIIRDEKERVDQVTIKSS